MKKRIFLGLTISLITLASCQNELYTNPAEKYTSPQGIYMANEGPVQIFVEEDQQLLVKELKVALVNRTEQQMEVTVEVGNQAQLDAYNAKNSTQYLMLPKEMYKASDKLIFAPEKTQLQFPLQLSNIKFSQIGDYALPIKIKGNGVIEGKEEGILVLEKRIRTKVLRINGSGTEDDSMFPSDFKVDQWTMEIMINRAAYSANNRSICGTKLVANASPHDEIYTRFGDVTIDPNQLQIKTGSSQIDVDRNKFAAQANTWYMLTFVYNGTKNLIYVNGDLVAEREIRTGPYGLIGFWVGGANELVREVRFWKVARTAQEIKTYTWKMVNPDEEGLLLYYPMNGKKYDRESGKIIEDENRVWDWSKSSKHLNMPSSAVFDNNDDKYYIFPKEQ